MQASRQNDQAGTQILAADIAAFEKLREELERNHLDEFALFFQGEFLGVYPDFDSAGRAALVKSTAGPFLIQRIGRPIGLDPDTARHLSHR